LIDGSIYVVQFVKLMDGSQPDRTPNWLPVSCLRTPRRPPTPRHPLILDGLCLHVLS